MQVHVPGGTTTRVGMQNPVILRDVEDPYTGPTSVTPSASTQTLSVYGKTMMSDITVNPIPSNYGLITWDGAVLTVS